jgi:4-hydroxythreonine-4-phosphate dehydrogenase
MGDPAGVGPELCLRILRNPRILRRCAPVVFGDADIMKQVGRQCRLGCEADVVPLELWQRGIRGSAESDFAKATSDMASPSKSLSKPVSSAWRAKLPLSRPMIVDCCSLRGADIRPGRIQKACGRAAYAYIEAAVGSAMAGRTSAVVTAPIHKESLRLAGIPYPGHTEILAELTGTDRVCMMLASDEITVSLVTTHTAYGDVPAEISQERILDVIRLTVAAMERLGKRNPRITVCALNPHAGEHGLFGDDERKIVEPAVRAARKRGFHVTGPLPPDTAFIPARRKTTDAYVAMYHDQGLIPFKMLAFDKGVNITLGLPIVRTSVDHGTAFDIAWQGKASPNSLIQAVLWAVKLTR